MGHVVLYLNDFLFSIMCIFQFILCSYLTAITYRLLTYEIANDYIKVIISGIIFILALLGTVFIISEFINKVSSYSFYKSIDLLFVIFIIILLFMVLLIIEYYREIRILNGNWEENTWGQSTKLTLNFSGNKTLYGEMLLSDKNTGNILKKADLSCTKNPFFSVKLYKLFIVYVDNLLIGILQVELLDGYIELSCFPNKYNAEAKLLFDNFGDLEKKYYKRKIR